MDRACHGDPLSLAARQARALHAEDGIGIQVAGHRQLERRGDERAVG